MKSLTVHEPNKDTTEPPPEQAFLRWLLPEDAASAPPVQPTGSSWCPTKQRRPVPESAAQAQGSGRGQRLEKLGPDASNSWKKTQPLEKHQLWLLGMEGVRRSQGSEVSPCAPQPPGWSQDF